jgi:hypothetical protein
MINLGFLIFLFVAIGAFWVLIFLGSFIPYWIFMSLSNSMKPKTADMDDDDEDEYVEYIG